MPQRNSYASTNRYSTATSGGRPSTEIVSEESEYSDGGTFVRCISGFELQERRRVEREREAERQRQILDFVNRYRDCIISAITTAFGKSVEEVVSGFDGLTLERRHAWADWARQASPMNANRRLLYEGLDIALIMLDRNSRRGSSQAGTEFRARHSFGYQQGRRHRRLSDMSVERITRVMEDVLRQLGLR